MLSIILNISDRHWDTLIAIAIPASISLMALGIANGDIAYHLMPVLYGLDALCLLDLVIQLGRNRRFASIKTANGWAARANSSPSNHLLIFILIATLPWELIIATDSLVAGALPALWMGRFIRILQLHQVLTRIEHSHYLQPWLYRTVRLVLYVLLTIHCLSCGWLLFGFTQENSWLNQRDWGSLSFDSLYIRSVYWAITTMTTVGYGDITPGTDAEYVFSALVMLAGASFYAYIIGNVASLLNQLNASEAKYLQRSQFVCKYLFRQGVPDRIIERVQDYFGKRWQRFRDYNEDEILSELPANLALEVKHYLAKNIIRDVPLFKHASPVIKQRLLSALEFEFVPSESWVAHCGEMNQKIVFILSGTLEIYPDGDDTPIEQLGASEYFGNYSLALSEPRTASVKCKTYCELLYLHQQDYEQIKQSYPEFQEVIKKAMAENSQKMSELVLQGIIL